ncbi:MAG: FAD/NAD(P)-binding protein, partial [Victivallales bacterium]|nr:FAD/NAD(P)-binding protein [Victivallales bacterium]
LHMLKEGDELGIRGPLGNYYPVEEFKNKNVVLVGGGFGVTTLRSLAVYLRDPAHRADYGDITFIYGARNPGAMIYRNEFEKWENEEDIDMNLTIDKPVKGWNKKVGFVPNVTKEVAPGSDNSVIMVCGPPIMIKFTLPVLAELGFSKDSIYTSLERRMKCGIGKCGRCNIGSKYVCVDGPVFSYRELEKLNYKF